MSLRQGRSNKRGHGESGLLQLLLTLGIHSFIHVCSCWTQGGKGGTRNGAHKMVERLTLPCLAQLKAKCLIPCASPVNYACCPADPLWIHPLCGPSRPHSNLPPSPFPFFFRMHVRRRLDIHPPTNSHEPMTHLSVNLLSGHQTKDKALTNPCIHSTANALNPMHQRFHPPTHPPTTISAGNSLQRCSQAY